MDAFAWPLGPLASGIFFVVFFRRPIEERFEHLRSNDRRTVALDLAVEQQPVERQAGAEKSNQAEVLLKSFDSPGLLQRERLLFAYLQARNLDSNSDTTKDLVFEVEYSDDPDVPLGPLATDRDLWESKLQPRSR